MSKLSPMMEQYISIKEQHSDKIVFFQVGDFYELFYDDARTASRELDLVLTSRDGDRENRVPLAGVPMHAINNYLNRLIDRGYKVVICDQVEDPAQTKGLVRREVTRIVTPGTITDQNLLMEKKNNYLISLIPGADGYGLAISDVSTGDFWATQVAGETAGSIVCSEWQRIMPAECICHPSLQSDMLLEKCLQVYNKTLIEHVPAEYYAISEAYRILEKHWPQTKILMPEMAVSASAALLKYIKNLQKTELKHMHPPVLYYPGDYMAMDGITRRNLELSRTIREGKKKGSLLEILDHTCCSMGGRLLKRWIEQPLKDVEQITHRLDAVEELIGKSVLKTEIRTFLKKIYDLERLCGRINFGNATPRDLTALKESLALLPAIISIMKKTEAELLKKTTIDMPDFTDLTAAIGGALVDNPPLAMREGGIIRDGYNTEVDRLRKICRDSKNWLLEIENAEKTKTGIKTLKIGYNKIYGYYLEVTKANIDMIPPHYHRKQTLVNAERYITEELKKVEEQISGADEKLAALEYHIFMEIRDIVSANTPMIQQAASLLAGLDCLQALAEAAVVHRYCRPAISPGKLLEIKDARHPVVEKMALLERFVPNDVFMNEQQKMLIITGPNMAGKSTYCRSVALICLMGQMGSFVPAEKAILPVLDKIFARVGASDDLSSGQSTFMVEMSETASILKEATPNSLVVLDEIGRGTSTYDGMSIARSVLEYVNRKLDSWTLFSTHYHELTVMEEELPGVKNYTMAIREKGDNVVFLRKIIPGRADRSYGINVARLAGLPVEVVERARAILRETEKAALRRDDKRQITLFELNNTPKTGNDAGVRLIREIEGLYPEQMTPLEALQALFTLKKLSDEYE